MARQKKVTGLIKLQIKAGMANPAPPIGPALGQHGVNIMEFCKAYNAATESQRGQVVPVEISVYEDRSFTFVTKTPPAARLLLAAAGVDKGSGEPHKTKVATVSKAQVREIAQTWSRVTVATLVLCGSPEPFSTPAALSSIRAAGGVLVTNVNERSS